MRGDARARERAVLVVGGLDPTGQAGLARDLDAFARERVRACPVASGLTVQTSRAFHAANPTPADVLVAQAEAALDEFDVRWAKVGALFGADQVDAVAGLVRDRRLGLVLDPVLTATAGAPFLDAAAASRLRDALVPRAFLVTPNEREAHALTGEEEPARAAATLVASGAKAALVKRSGRAPDMLFDGRATHALPAQPLPGTHRGTGCRLASRIAARLARGMGVAEAVRAAHAGLQEELRLDAAEQAQAQDPRRRDHWRELEDWLPRILDAIRSEDVPEVGMNVAYALPAARDPRADVLGLAGRITIAGTGRAVAGRLAWGGPHHTGRLAIVLAEHDPEARMVMNHRFDEAYVEAARAAGLRAAGFRREDEPPGTPSTMEWGLRAAIAANGGAVPDLVYDRGGPGKEPMIRVVARHPADLVAKLRAMHGQATARGFPLEAGTQGGCRPPMPAPASGGPAPTAS